MQFRNRLFVLFATAAALLRAAASENEGSPTDAPTTYSPTQSTTFLPTSAWSSNTEHPTPDLTDTPTFSADPDCSGNHTDLVDAAFDSFGPNNCQFIDYPNGVRQLKCSLFKALCVYEAELDYYWSTFIKDNGVMRYKPQNILARQGTLCYEECLDPETPFYIPTAPAFCEYLEDNIDGVVLYKNYAGANDCVFFAQTNFNGQQYTLEGLLTDIRTVRSSFIGTEQPSEVPSGSPTAYCGNNADDFEVKNKKVKKKKQKTKQEKKQKKTQSCDGIAKMSHEKKLRKCQNVIVAENCPGLCDRDTCPCTDYNSDGVCDKLSDMKQSKREKKCQKPQNLDLCPSVCDFRRSTAVPTMAPTTPAPVLPTPRPFDDGCDD